MPTRRRSRRSRRRTRRRSKRRNPSPREIFRARRSMGLPKFYTKRDLTKKYRQLALRLHPDKAGPGSKAAFQTLDKYYKMLRSAPTPPPPPKATAKKRQRSRTVSKKRSKRPKKKKKSPSPIVMMEIENLSPNSPLRTVVPVLDRQPLLPVSYQAQPAFTLPFFDAVDRQFAREEMRRRRQRQVQDFYMDRFYSGYMI